MLSLNGRDTIQHCTKTLRIACAATLGAASLLLAQTHGPLRTIQSDMSASDMPASGTAPTDAEVVRLADGVVRASPAGSPTAGTTEAFLPMLYASAHAANLLPLANGDLLCFWFSGTWEGQSNVGIVMSRLAKGSHRWSPTVLIDRHDGESYQNPAAFQDRSGTIHLYHTTQPANGGEDEARVLQLTSHDNGHTWQGPEVLFDKPGAYARHPPIALADGAWLLPLYYSTSKGIGAGAESNYSVTKISRDDGRTWQECAIPGSAGKVQPSIVAASPQHLIAFFRSRASDFIDRSDSTDGCHWSPPQSTGLPNNNASVQALRLLDGSLVMVFNNSSDDRSGASRVAGLRKPLSIALSHDDGRTWQAIRDIETGRPGMGAAEQKPKVPGREEYSYPSVVQTADGRIYVAFTFRRITIKVVSFAESWIAAGTTTGKVTAPFRSSAAE